MKKYIRGLRAPVALLAASLMIGTAFAEESSILPATQAEQEQAGQELEEELKNETLRNEEKEEEKDSEQNEESQDDVQLEKPDAGEVHPDQKPADEKETGQEHPSSEEGQKENAENKDELLEADQNHGTIDVVPEETIKEPEEISESEETSEPSQEEKKDAEVLEPTDKELPDIEAPANKVTADKNDEILEDKKDSDSVEIEEALTDGNTEVKAPIFQLDHGIAAEQFKDLKLSETQIKELIRMTDGEMSEERLQVVLHAYSLVGKVHYFWGGKSEVIGWDERWGIPAIVTSEGSDTTGTACTYGLDCSGFITWAFLNAAGDAGIVGDIGHGTSAQWGHSAEIEEKDALPGDLAFMAPGDSSDNHVGIVVGRNKSGQLMFVHCSGGYDNVVVTTANEGCFSYLRRPDVYTDKSIGFSEMVESNPKAMTKSNRELFEKYLDLKLLKNEG